jgi:hypothetical protein
MVFHVVAGVKRRLQGCEGNRSAQRQQAAGTTNTNTINFSKNLFPYIKTSYYSSAYFSLIPLMRYVPFARKKQ